VEFTYTPDQLELRDRASRLTDAIIPFEDPCEAGRGLDDESLAEIRRLTLEHQLNAINMPVEWGGQGLSVLDQVIVSERLGQLTNALWDAVWRPANALRHCTPEQRERYLIPAIAGDRRDCFAVTEEKAGSDPSLIETVAAPAGDGSGGYRISGEKWFVTVGDIADFMIVQALVGDERAPTLFLVDKDSPGVSVKRTPAYMHTFVFEHPEFIFDEVAVGPEKVLGEIGGGYVVASGGEVLAELALPLAGLISLETFEAVRAALVPLRGAARDLGCTLPEPFLQVSFLPLPVIAHMKITDLGLFDVDRFALVEQ